MAQVMSRRCASRTPPIPNCMTRLLSGVDALLVLPRSGAAEVGHRAVHRPREGFPGAMTVTFIRRFVGNASQSCFPTSRKNNTIVGRFHFEKHPIPSAFTTWICVYVWLCDFLEDVTRDATRLQLSSWSCGARSAPTAPALNSYDFRAELLQCTLWVWLKM